jgi:glycosyltransferase involved in cell wall biosynthesis
MHGRMPDAGTVHTAGSTAAILVGSAGVSRRTTPARRTQPTVTVVIPALNEARNIGWTLERLPDCVTEVVVVDGRSADDTVAVARAVRPDVVVVDQPRRGKGLALRTGFSYATGDYIIMIDADGSMDPGEIPLYVAFLEHGYDLVKGSRFALGGGSDDMSLVRRVGHWPLRELANVLFGISFTDLCYGFCAFRRDRLPDLDLHADGFEIETELLLRAVKAGLVMTEAPSFELPRRSGESNLRTFRDGGRVLRTLLRERMNRAPRGRGPAHEAIPVAIGAGATAHSGAARAERTVSHR